MKKFLTLALGVLSVALALYTWHLNTKVRELASLEPVQVTDTLTLTDWQHDTVYRTDTKVETLRLVDTAWLSDTVTDSVYVQVEVPIYTYQFDTTQTTDSTSLHLKAVLEGFEVKFLSLSAEWSLTPQKAQKTRNTRCLHFGPAVGVGYGTGGWGVFVGVGCVF